MVSLTETGRYLQLWLKLFRKVPLQMKKFIVKFARSLKDEKLPGLLNN